MTSHSAAFAVQSPAIWLIPYAQLKGAAQALWLAKYADKPMPQITTMRDWAASLGVVAKTSLDFYFDAGIDRLAAASRLAGLRLGSESVYVQRLVAMTQELAPVLAAMPPASRAAWVDARVRGVQRSGVLEVESALGLLALAWASQSRYGTDILWQRQAALLACTEHFYVSTGVQPDPLVQAFLLGAEHKVTAIDLDESSDAPTGEAFEYCADDAEDLVQQTAALVLQQCSRVSSLALIALDRQVTRRISAVLANRGVRVVDETGWALSTTTAAASLMAWLSAMQRNATSDAVVDALKTAPKRFASSEVDTLEQHIRRYGAVQWVDAGSDCLGTGLDAWPARFLARRTLVDWLALTQELLQYVGLWEAYQSDAAGIALLGALHFGDATLGDAAGLMSLHNYTAWVRAALEENRFRLKFNSTPVDAPTCIVTTLPLAQSFGRRFDVVVAPGCDEGRLPARPHKDSAWGVAERLLLGLPSANDEAQAQRLAWTWLLGLPHVCLLWPRTEGVEALTRSSLLDALALENRLTAQPSPLQFYAVAAADTRRVDVFSDGVRINWQTLSPPQLSASSYADLRACPYRFYATRILSLQSAEELDEAVDKRDFGTWLHGTLHRFHEALRDNPTDERDALLQACGRTQQRAMRLTDAAFLPFALVWPQTRKAYLAWLAKHDADGASYTGGEVNKKYALHIAGKNIDLVGKIDRIDEGDSHSARTRWLLDYKTEAADKTKGRIKNAAEDTQLAFYAALMQGDLSTRDAPVRAAYVNLVERGKGAQQTQLFELENIESRQADLLRGIASDLSGMAAGEALKALGEGEACAFCAVRGLCRKDFV